MKTYSVAVKNARLLQALYLDQNLSSEEIARRLGIDGRLIRTWLYKFGIPLRSPSEFLRLSWQKRRKKITATCFICGKELAVIPSRYKKFKKFYCTRECQIKDYGGSLDKARQTYCQTHPRTEKVCPVCHTIFSVVFSTAQRRIYCSYQCKGIAQMIANGAKKTPTGPEQKIIDIIGKHFPDFKYNGNGELAVVLAGMIPDFININGRKQIIEVFGDYYHGQICRNWKNSELGKRMAYNSIGYDCLILWEHDIKNQKDEDIVASITAFCHPKAKRGYYHG